MSSIPDGVRHAVATMDQKFVTQLIIHGNRSNQVMLNSLLIIVDLSGPSVPHELSATVPDFKVPFVPIMEKAKPLFDVSGSLRA